MVPRSVRRSFAAPFVVISLVGCHRSDPAAPIYSNPPGPTDTPPSHDPPAPDPGSAAPPPVATYTNPPPPDTARVVANPPPPSPDPVDTETDASTRWSIAKLHGACNVALEGTCGHFPKGQPLPACNPPAPRPIACPSQVTEGGFVKVVRHVGQTDCFIESPGHASIRCPDAAP